jgi:membrane protein required for colicin V production
MTGFDIAVLLLVGTGAVLGFMRGFVQEIMSLAGWFVAVFAIRFFHAPLSAFLQPHIGSSSGGSVLAFAILAIVPYLLAKMAARWAGGSSRNSFLGPIDRVLGFGFGAVKGMILTVLGFSVLVLAYDVVWGAGGRPQWITQSRSYDMVNAASEKLLARVAERRKAAVEGSSKPHAKKKVHD